MPKFIGPYQIEKAFGNEIFHIVLPDELKCRGIHPSFHTSLLRIHHPNDDCLFPGQDMSQVTGISFESEEWAVERIEAHTSHGPDLMFKVKWWAGDMTWLPHDHVAHLEPLQLYLEAQNVSSVSELKNCTKARHGNSLKEDSLVRYECMMLRIELDAYKDKQAEIEINNPKYSLDKLNCISTERLISFFGMEGVLAQLDSALVPVHSHPQLLHSTPTTTTQVVMATITQQVSITPAPIILAPAAPVVISSKQKKAKHDQNALRHTSCASSASDGESLYDSDNPKPDEHHWHEGPCSVKLAPNLHSPNPPVHGY